MDSTFPQQATVRSSSTTQALHPPLNFTPDHRGQTGFGEVERGHGLPPLDVTGVDVVGASPVFHSTNMSVDGFSNNAYGSGASGTTDAAAHGGFNGAAEPMLGGQQRQHNQPPQRKQLPGQRQPHESAGVSPGAAPGNAATPSFSQLGLLAPMPRDGSADRVSASSANDSAGLEPPRSRQLPAKFVENPPNLVQWREKLFDLKEAVILTPEEFETYFPWVDNVYSHRSTQRYKRKSLVTHYYDCRLKGRPAGTSKSLDPAKKKRKRTARERDLCDVKIKVTEYQAGSASELRADDGMAMERGALEEALARVRDGSFWMIQRIYGSGTDGAPSEHKHTLEDSDNIKKSSTQRWLAEREREAKRSQKSSPWKPTGDAAMTAKKHSKEAGMKFLSACFCPFSQRVWIALEAKGLEYQYCETYPLRKPKPTVLLEANPRGRVPAIREEGDWACAESSVILEYLEDLGGAADTAVLHPTIPRLKANCRQWIDFINTRVVPSFFSVLAATDEESRGRGIERLKRDLYALVGAAADAEEGPYFLGDHMCLVDVNLAPFALRLSRLPQVFRGLRPPTVELRWQKWLDALENNPHVRNTMSANSLYTKSMDDLLRGFQGVSD